MRLSMKEWDSKTGLRRDKGGRDPHTLITTNLSLRSLVVTEAGLRETVFPSGLRCAKIDLGWQSTHALSQWLWLPFAATMLPVGRQQIAHVVHQTQSGEFLFDGLGRRIFESVGDLFDQQLCESNAGAVKLLPR